MAITSLMLSTAPCAVNAANWIQHTVIEAQAENGAAALGLGAEVGSLEVGKKADLIVLDARRPHLVPALRIVSGWIHAEEIGRRVWRQLVERYPTVPFPITLPPLVSRSSHAE